MKQDRELYEDVMEQLKFTPNVNERHITISVSKGVVDLAGTVSSWIAKYNAERAVRNIVGVKAVANEIEVKWGDNLTYTDVDIAKAATEALDWNVEVPIDSIKVTVDGGNIKLTGQVDYQYQRQSAEKTVRGLRGVKSVNNIINISPKHNEVDVKKAITKEFHRNAQIDAEDVKVSIDKTKVILTGKVKSYAEYKAAEHAAWCAPGITKVDNLLTIN